MRRCAELDDVLKVDPTFGTFGGASSGSVTVSLQPVAGQTFTITDASVFPNAVTTYTATAGVPGAQEFAIGADMTETATNLAAAIEADAARLARAQSSGSVVQLQTETVGPNSEHTLSQTGGWLTLPDPAQLDGGSDVIDCVIDCVCASFSLECWGDQALCASTYLILHDLTVQQGGQEKGALKRKKIDKIETEHEIKSVTELDGNYTSTKWGRLYLQLLESRPIVGVAGRRKNCPVGILVV